MTIVRTIIPANATYADHHAGDVATVSDEPEGPALPDLPCEACQHPASVHEEDGCYRCLTEGGPCE